MVFDEQFRGRGSGWAGQGVLLLVEFLRATAFLQQLARKSAPDTAPSASHHASTWGMQDRARHWVLLALVQLCLLSLFHCQKYIMGTKATRPALVHSGVDSACCSAPLPLMSLFDVLIVGVGLA